MRRTLGALVLLLAPSVALAAGIERLTEKSFARFLGEGDAIVVVHGKHDDPSKTYLKTFRAYCEGQERVRCGALDMDEEYFAGLRSYDVLPIPTTLFVRDGRLLRDHTTHGPLSVEELGGKADAVYGTR